MSKLDGKIALISGSGRGIGREIALKLAKDGARIVVNDLDGKFAEETVAAIRGAGSDAVACVGNVTDADFGDRLVKRAVDTFGGVDIIVNNAGYTWDNVVQKMTDEQLRDDRRAHDRAVSHSAGCRRFYPSGGKAGGRGGPRRVPQSRQHLVACGRRR
jgi:NAD(P)-dependent dehydrogenase (short-subunit alcohol dehydrogenase family)